MSDFRIDCINALYRLGIPAVFITEFSDLPYLAERVAYDHKTTYRQLLLQQPLSAIKALITECEYWAD